MCLHFFETLCIYCSRIWIDIIGFKSNFSVYQYIYWMIQKENFLPANLLINWIYLVLSLVSKRCGKLFMCAMEIVVGYHLQNYNNVITVKEVLTYCTS